MKPDVMTLPYNAGAQEIEAGQSEILPYLELHTKFKANMGNMGPCLNLPMNTPLYDDSKIYTLLAVSSYYVYFIEDKPFHELEKL